MEIRKPFAKILKDIRKKLGKSQKNSRENSKLKKKTQNSRKKLNVSEDCPSPDLPSDVKKSLLRFYRVHPLQKNLTKPVKKKRYITVKQCFKLSKGPQSLKLHPWLEQGDPHWTLLGAQGAQKEYLDRQISKK